MQNRLAHPSTLMTRIVDSLKIVSTVDPILMSRQAKSMLKKMFVPTTMFIKQVTLMDVVCWGDVRLQLIPHNVHKDVRIRQSANLISLAPAPQNQNLIAPFIKVEKMKSLEPPLTTFTCVTNPSWLTQW